jgi:hypothetical protein
VSQAYRLCSVMLLADASLFWWFLFSDIMLDQWWSCCVHYSVSVFLRQKCCSEACPVAIFS